MRKQLAVFLAIVLIGAIGFLSLPIGGMTVTTSGGLLSVRTNVALAVQTTNSYTQPLVQYSAGITRVQGNCRGAGTTSLVSVTMTSTPTAGDVLVAVLGADGKRVIESIICGM